MEGLIYNDANHTYSFEGHDVPSVTRILVDEGFVNTTWYTEEARERGSRAHFMIANHAKGAHCISYKDCEPYINAYKKFMKECDWKPELIEHQMGCNLFAGTMDQAGTMDGKKAIIDFKTGVITSAAALQLAAYEKLWNIWENRENIRRAEKIILPPIVRRFGVQLTSEEKYILHEFKDRNDRYVWDSAVAIWWWKKNKGVRK